MANLIPTVATVAVLLIITAATNASFFANVSEPCHEERYNMRDCEMYIMGDGCPCETERMKPFKMRLFTLLLGLQCCDQLKQVREESRCEKLQAIAADLREQGVIANEEYEGAMQRASNIGSSCGQRRCDIQTI
ncbi:2S seed storage albumin protein-like [Mercurialis annua]|uniref:2S seed storage albumin protein-like n=1 Tax=Mercurialis annua TaxID=3986 RepID=UPI002160D70C|nr:2S seed storage albumin protein-like [Mercurialis annua]